MVSQNIIKAMIQCPEMQIRFDHPDTLLLVIVKKKTVYQT